MNDQYIKGSKARTDVSSVGRFFRSLQQFTRAKLGQGKSTLCGTMLTIRIYASELHCLCRDAVKWGDKETGGHLFGNYTGSGVPVVMLATLPGPKAVHNVASFWQDLEYCQTSSEFLLEHFGLCMVGRWHSHHQIGLCSPSGGDRDTARSILERNALPAFAEIIVTLNPQDETVCVHPHVFVPGEPFEERPAKLIIIPGLSPIREAAFGSVVFPNRELSEWRFPMERIVVDGAIAGPTPEIPDVLIQQIAGLPVDVQRGIKIAIQDGAISVEVPLEGLSRAFVGYDAAAPHRPVAVFIKRSSDELPWDATAIINPSHQPLSLESLFQRLLHQSSLPPTSHATSQDGPQLAAPITPGNAPQSPPPLTDTSLPKPVAPKSGGAKRAFKKATTPLSDVGRQAKRVKKTTDNRS